jgi:hypothetical protein
VDSSAHPEEEDEPGRSRRDSGFEKEITSIQVLVRYDVTTFLTHA